MTQPTLQTVAPHRVAEAFAQDEDDAPGPTSGANPKQLALRPRHTTFPGKRRGNSDGETLAAPTAAAVQHRTTTGGLHALAESVLVSALSVAGLKAARGYGVDTDKWYARMLKDQDEYRKNREKNKPHH